MRFNTERTALDAPLVFIISPYQGKDIQEQRRNIAFAKALAYRAAEDGNLPIMPHLYFTGFLSDQGRERDWGIEAGHRMMRYCNKVFVAAIEGEISEGMERDIEFARRMRGIEPVIIRYTKNEVADIISYYYSQKDKQWRTTSI